MAIIPDNPNSVLITNLISKQLGNAEDQLQGAHGAARALACSPQWLTHEQAKELQVQLTAVTAWADALSSAIVELEYDEIRLGA